MALTSVLSIFRIVAPGFKGIDDETVNLWIELTDPLVSRRRFGRLHSQALAFLTAHRMYLADIGHEDEEMVDGLNLGNLAAGKTRHISSFSEGKVSISFNHDQGDLDTEGDAYYGLSKYGIEFLKLRRKRVVSLVSAAEPKGR